MPSRTTTYVDRGDYVEIEMPPGSAAEPVEARHHQFIVEHWTGLAAAAYEGFRSFGVGLVVVEDVERAGEVPAPSPPFVAHQVSYALSGGAWMRGLDLGTASAWLDARLQEYDPREVCLFVFAGERGLAHVYQASGSLAPQQALRRLKALLN